MFGKCIPYLERVSKYEERSQNFETKSIPIENLYRILNNAYPDARITEYMIREEMCCWNEARAEGLNICR